jgi:hypothetical protein
MQRALSRKGASERSTMLPSARCSATVFGVANRLEASPREATVMCFLLARDPGSAAASFRATLAIMLSTAIVVVNNNLPFGRRRRYKDGTLGDTM